MAADRNDPRLRETDPAVRPKGPPPKPNRTLIGLVVERPAIEVERPLIEEDDTTIRFQVGDLPEAQSAPSAPVVDRTEVDRTPTVRPGPPPLPPPFPLAVASPFSSPSNAFSRTQSIALEALKGGALRLMAAKERLPKLGVPAKIGIGIFTAGVLVGVIGSAVMTKDPAPQVLEAAVPNARAATLPPSSLAPTTAAPVAAPIERPAEGVKPAVTEEDSGVGRRTTDPKKEATSPPIPNANAPSCEKLLGFTVIGRDGPIAAQRETRAANRELLRGNVAAAHAAYCRAFALDHTNVDRHVNLARVLLVRRDWEKAAAFGQSALDIDSKNRGALGAAGDAWAALHETDKARTAWLAVEGKSTASARDVNLFVRRNMALGQRMERLKDFQLAERIYRRVLLFAPEHVEATKGVSRCLSKTGNPKAAQAWSRRADVLKRGK